MWTEDWGVNTEKLNELASSLKAESGYLLLNMSSSKLGLARGIQFFTVVKDSCEFFGLRLVGDIRT